MTAFAAGFAFVPADCLLPHYLVTGGPITVVPSRALRSGDVLLGLVRAEAGLLAAVERPSARGDGPTYWFIDDEDVTHPEAEPKLHGFDRRGDLMRLFIASCTWPGQPDLELTPLGSPSLFGLDTGEIVPFARLAVRPADRSA